MTWTDPHCGYNPDNCPYGDACADCRPEEEVLEVDPEQHPLLAARLQWELDNPRPESLRKAEKMIVQGLVQYGFGQQYQVTAYNSFEIAVDDIVITVELNGQIVGRTCGGCGQTFYEYVDVADEQRGRCPRCSG